MTFNIIGKRYWFFLISGVIIVLGLLSWAIFGLKTGVEFSSGSLLTIQFEQEVTQTQLEEELLSLGFSDTIVQQTQPTGNFLIRTHFLNEDEKTELENNLQAALGNFSGEPSFEIVDPMIAGETRQTAIIAVVFAAVGILAYVTWAFRRMPKPFHYGTCAIIALVHDALIALGVFAILGAAMGWQINLMFITGVLAVIGYSVNNTVVIFDRIRENLTRGIGGDFETVVNNSLVETLGRSLNTSLTTLIVILALMFFVGATIQNFVVVLIIGVIAGTFSSICIAPSLLVVWDNKEWGRFIPRFFSSKSKA